MKALVGAFNQERALVGAFSVIVQVHRLIVYSTSPGGGLRRAGEGGEGRAAPRARGLAQEADLRVALIQVETLPGNNHNHPLIFQLVKHWFNVALMCIDIHNIQRTACLCPCL